MFFVCVELPPGKMMKGKQNMSFDRKFLFEPTCVFMITFSLYLSCLRGLRRVYCTACLKWITSLMIHELFFHLFNIYSVSDYSLHLHSVFPSSWTWTWFSRFVYMYPLWKILDMYSLINSTPIVIILMSQALGDYPKIITQ